MGPTDDSGDESAPADVIARPPWVTWMHAAGVALSLVALAMRGLDSPAIGFPIAIAVLSGLGVPSSPHPRDPAVLRRVHGGILAGGIRQGAFIKAMFAVSLLYMGAHQALGATIGVGTTNLLLGLALATSAVASEIEASRLRTELRRLTGEPSLGRSP